jgi:tetratricopeptide (TPR) repeat protein
MDASLSRDDEEPFPIMTIESGSISLPDHSQLFQQGLILADQLDALSEISVDNSEIWEDQAPPADALSPMEWEDITVLQSESLSGSLSAFVISGQQPQTDAQSWAQVWVSRGLSKLKAGNLQGALENFIYALEKHPNLLEAMVGQGIVNYHLGNFREAAQAFQEAIKQQIHQSELYCYLGTALYRLGNVTEALIAYEKAVHLNPQNDNAYYGLGIASAYVQNYERAIDAFQLAIAIAHHADSYYGLGYVHFLLQDFPAAIAAIGKAKQRDGKYRPIYEKFLKHCLKE